VPNEMWQNAVLFGADEVVSEYYQKYLVNIINKQNGGS
jgi:hypothetical protein